MTEYNENSTVLKLPCGLEVTGSIFDNKDSSLYYQHYLLVMHVCIEIVMRTTKGFKLRLHVKYRISLKYPVVNYQ
jgi:glucosamine 6-phosphate synthetase-like amidotransferase/phosphosugar isomerase protein